MTPIPPPPARPAVILYDTECYPNYWLLKMRPRGGQTFTFKLHTGQVFSPEQVASIKRLFELFTTISFNGIYYDLPVISCALAGYTVEQLKWLNDRIIVDKMRPWDLNLPSWQPADHIDLMEVAPGAGSLKQYAARLHSRTIRDLPYPPDQHLTADEIVEVESYCETDLDDLDDLYESLQPQIHQRVALGERYGLDLRSKSDAQVAETVLKKRCELALGCKIYKPQVDYAMRFRYEPPAFIAFEFPQLRHLLETASTAVFTLGPNGGVMMPPQLEGYQLSIGQSVYKVGIGGLHSQEKCTVHVSDDNFVLRDNDVASYYPQLILNSGKFPPALGQAFLQEYEAVKNERLAAKKLQAKLKKLGDTSSREYEDAKVGNEGGKIMINGTFGKTGSVHSVLFAPSMLIQTTLTGQLSLLMLIEWHEHYGIQVISANTDGIVIKCPRDKVQLSEFLIAEWQRRTGLEMETVEYSAIYSRDVNNYFAIKSDGDVKRKGEYASTRDRDGRPDLQTKKNPDMEICSDAVADYLANGTPIEYTIAACRDIRKFLVVQKVAGGGVKMWGHGPKKDARVRDMVLTLEINGWVKSGRQWRKGETVASARAAYESCFAPQVPEYLGKVIRWYYSTQAPGPIVYASNGNTVNLSYGGHPCMTLPDELPDDIDYPYYITKAYSILHDIGCNR